MQDFKKFIKTSGIYFIGNVLSKLVSVFTLTIYTRYLTPQEYGQYDLYMAYLSFFVAICFLDVGLCAMKFMLENNYKSIINYHEKIIFAMSLLIALLSSVFLILFTIFSVYIYKDKIMLLREFVFIKLGYKKS